MSNDTDTSTEINETQPRDETVTHDRVPAPSKPPRQRRASPLLLIVVLLIAALVGLWFWKQAKIKDLNKRITTLGQQTTAENQATKPAATQAQTKTGDQPTVNTSSPANTTISDNLLTGVSDISATRVMLDVLFKYKDNIQAVWIEYGESPINLNKSTTKADKALGEGPPDVTYSPQSFILTSTELKHGTRYYFRAVSQYGGQVEKSAISSFVTLN